MRLVLFLSIFAFASYGSMRVMTFNTTCSMCGKKKFDKFKKRKHWIVETIKRADPDLVSLQEVLFIYQLKWFKRQLRDYRVVYYRKNFVLRYADPALFVRKSRFEVGDTFGFWLGPRRGRFSLGWKKGFPRRVQSVYLYDKQTGHDFLFVGSHFDNASKNKNRSARMLVKRLEAESLPVLFAADTNLKPEHEGFETLKEVFIDSFDITEKLSFLKNSDTNKDDSCNLEKGKTFPSCRVDHIMLSKKDRWKVLDWSVDQYRYGKKQRFTSDHRAIFVDLELN